MLSWTVSVAVNDVDGKSICVVSAVGVIDVLVSEGVPRVEDELVVVNVIVTPVGTPAKVSRIPVPFATGPAD
jgi:hypothetical protein